MGADFQIKRELDRMIGKVTEKSAVRQSQLKSFPLCIMYGEFPEEIKEMLRMELADRTGNPQAAEMAVVPYAAEMAAAVTAAVHHFQDRIGQGVLQKCNRLYIAFCFMADKLEAADVKDCFQQFPKLMQRLINSSSVK